MRFTIKAGELASVLNSLSGLAKGQTMPILGCVKITVEDAHLQVEATDLATRSTCRWPATPSSVGATCVNANRLLGLMRGLPSSMVVEITGTKEHLTIKGHRSRYRLAALSEFDFPQRPDAVANTTCLFQAGALHRGLSAVIKVVDNMAATGSMSSGASITITEGSVESIAAEAGRVTYVREFSEDIHAAGPISKFVNRNTGKELLRLLGYTVFESYVVSTIFAIIWGMMIFNLDRYIVSGMRKKSNFLKELAMAAPRIILAVFIGIVIATPLELKLFE